MNIFLSHSVKDRWVAAKICADLEAIGASVFLAERDIATGQGIDDEIRAHLHAADHFLLLLSPASRSSEWVLLELGAALQLHRHIVPILLHVGANEVPQAVVLKLARDINDIGTYYHEVEALVRPAGRAHDNWPSPPAPPRGPRHSPARFSIGSQVRIDTNEPSPVLRRDGRDVTWVPQMDSYLGRTGTVTGTFTDGDVRLDVDNGTFAWAPEWLAPVRAR